MTVDQSYCYSAYVMDRYCIDRGTLLDAPSLATLSNPHLHSVHCLVDVGSCVTSPFELLSLNSNDDGVHCRAYTLSSQAHDATIDLAREIGSCSTCSSSGETTHGFSALFVGTIDGTTFNAETILPLPATCPEGSIIASPDLDCTSGSSLPSIYAHGSLMLCGWGFLLPLGVISARYLRHRPNSLWFKLHRRFQVVGILIAFVGFIVAIASFAVFKSGASPRSTAHGSMGLVVMTLGLPQPVNAFFRPHADEKSPARRNWERLHKTSGYVAVVLGVLTCAVGASIGEFLSSKEASAILNFLTPPTTNFRSRPTLLARICRLLCLDHSSFIVGVERWEECWKER